MKPMTIAITEADKAERIEIGRRKRDREGPSVWDRWRPLLMRWHFYAGLLVGPFLLIAAITGATYALIPQIDRAVYSHELTVDSVGEQKLPLGEQVAAARKAQTTGTILSVRPSPVPNETTRVSFDTDDVPKDLAKTVFVDPYTGEVRGSLNTYGQWLPVRTWFDDLHRNLHLGDFGRNYSEIAASWLAVVALAGLFLWIGHRRRTRKLKRVAVPDRRASKRLRTMSWHGSVGVWVILGLLVLSASGLSWSNYAGSSIKELRTAMQWKTPQPDTSATTVTHAPTAGDGAAVDVASYSRVHEVAEANGLVGPLVVTPPTADNPLWSVAENARGYPSHFDAIAVDPNTFQVTDRVDFADWPLAAKLTEWAISAHMGLFGVANQVILVLIAVGLITVIVRGYLMWWRRRPTGGTLPKAPASGALASLRPIEALILIGVIAFAGWYVPWFGIPLGLFVLLDAGRGLLSARASKAAQ